jgi:hypothetical protein
LAEGKTHKKIKLHVAWWLKRRAGYDVVAPEVMYNTFLADLLAVNTYKKKVGWVEVKASRSDFLREKGLTAKAYVESLDGRGMPILYGFYPSYADLAYIACPPYLIKPEEIAPYYGVLYVDINAEKSLDYGIRVVRRARHYAGTHVDYNYILRNCAYGLTNRWLKAESKDDEWFREYFKWLREDIA